jgi:heme-degrading monooxygenase HmoA
MLVRIVEAAVRENRGPALESVYQDQVIPALEKTQGCMFAWLLQGINRSGNYASLTIWDSEKHILDYTESGLYEKNLDLVRPYLDDSVEWKIKLSKRDTIEYVPVKREPVVKSYPVETKGVILPDEVEGNLKYLRVLSLKVIPGKEEEFKKIYENDILEALKVTPGCRYSFLVDNTLQKREFLSFTIWDDLESVNLYEKEGAFSNLLNKVKHTLSELYQWKMALESTKTSKYTVTSEDIDISKFTLVTGKKFNQK